MCVPRAGGWGYNSLLTGLTISSLWVLTMKTTILIALGGFFAAVIFGGMSHAFTVIGMPVMSFPFSISSVLVMLARYFRPVHLADASTPEGALRKRAVNLAKRHGAARQTLMTLNRMRRAFNNVIDKRGEAPARGAAPTKAALRARKMTWKLVDALMLERCESLSRDRGATLDVASVRAGIAAAADRFGWPDGITFSQLASNDLPTSLNTGLLIDALMPRSYKSVVDVVDVRRLAKRNENRCVCVCVCLSEIACVIVCV